MKEPRQPEWVKKATMEILQAMGYDLSKDIGEQFKEKYGEKLKGSPVPPIKKRRKYLKRQKI